MAKRIPPTFPRSRTILRELGGRLKAARLRRGLTQADLAVRVDVSTPTVAKLERGDPSTTFVRVGARFDADTLRRVLGVLRSR